MGFPEGLEKEGTDMFLEEWLRGSVLAGSIPKFFSVERSHRTPGKPPLVGSPARPIIARLLNFRDRDLILHLFRTRGPFKYENNIVSAYPGFTMEVPRRRAN